jgi:Flp pilus assembly protein TadD
MLKRDFARAAEFFERAIEEGLRGDSLAEAHTALGNALSELGRLDEARKEHEQALEIDPNQHQAWVNLGVVHRLQGDLDEAERCYREALRIAPEYAELHASLGALHIFRDEPERAIDALRHSISLNPQLPIAHANLAMALAMVGDFPGAESTLRHAVVLGYPNAAAVRERIDGLKQTRPVAPDSPAPHTERSTGEAEQDIIDIARQVVPPAQALKHFFVCSANPSLIDAFHKLLRVGAPIYGGSAGHYRADANALAARQAEATAADLSFAGERLLATSTSQVAAVADVLAGLQTEARAHGAHVAYVAVGATGTGWVREVYDNLLGQAVQQGILPFAVYSTDDGEAAKFLLDSFAPVSMD